MNKYKALFLDVDGTLVSQKKISPGNREAIFKALKAGIKITITSGRGSFMVIPMAHDLYIDAFGDSYSIVLNGSEIIKNCSCARTELSPDFGFPLEDKPKNPIPSEIKGFSLLKKYTMPKEVSDFLIGIGNRHRVHFHVYNGTSVYFMVPENPRFSKFTKYDGDIYTMVKEPDIEKRAGYCRKQPYIENLSLLAPKVYENYETPGEVNKIIFINDNARILDACFKEASALNGKVHMEYSDSHSLEFTPVEAGKGKGLLTVAKALGISPEETIAMGDGENDLSMLLSAGLSVVPSNALDSVKNQADVVLDYSCGEDAVAYAIRKYFSIK